MAVGSQTSTCSPGPGKGSREGSCLQQQSRLGHLCALVSPSATLGKTWIPPGSPESLGRDFTVHGLFDIVIASVQASKNKLSIHLFAVVSCIPATGLWCACSPGKWVSVPSPCGTAGARRGTKAQLTAHILKCQG